MRPLRVWAAAMVAVIALAVIAVPRPCRAAAAEPFTINDLQDLLQQKLGRDKILEILASKCLTFLIDSATVSDLRSLGADDTLIDSLRTVCNPYQDLKDAQAEVLRVQHQVDSLRAELRSMSDSAMARRARLRADSLALAQQAADVREDSLQRVALEAKEGPRGAARIYAERAAKYAAAGNFEKAELDYRAAMRLTAPGTASASEKDYRAWALELGKLLYDRSEYKGAIDELGHSVEAGESWEAYYYTGLAWQHLNQPERAYRAWKRSLELADNAELRQKSTDRMKELSAGK